MKVIIVDSVKGGCGKTTIALKNAVEASKVLIEPQTEKSPKVCMIDFDLLGSSMETFLFGETTVPKPNEIPQNQVELHKNNSDNPGESFNSSEKEGLKFKMKEKRKPYLNEFFFTISTTMSIISTKFQFIKTGLTREVLTY